MFFCLNSMLAYLLRARSADQSIDISMVQRGSSVSVSMSAQVPKMVETHDLGAMIEATRAEISLGSDLLGRITREMEGEFKFKRERSGCERLTLRLVTFVGKRRHA